MTAARKWNAIAGPMPHSPEWNALRLYDPERKGREVVIGASEDADACNVGYRSALQVYLEKRGEMPLAEDSPEGEQRKRMGLRMERPILDEYQHQTGEFLIRDNLPMYFSPSNKFMAATPDAIGVDKSVNGTTRQQQLEFATKAVDAKNTTSRMYDRQGADEAKFGAEGTDGVPLSILMQAQGQCAVLDLPRVDFPVLFDGNLLRIYVVERNDDLIKAIDSAVTELCQRIIDGKPPEPNWTHSGTRKCLEAMHGCSIGTTWVGGDEELPIVLEWEGVKEQLKLLERKKDELHNKILAMGGSAQFMEFAGSDLRLKKIPVADSIVTERDVEELKAKVGQVGRKGHLRLQRVKAK